MNPPNPMMQALQQSRQSNPVSSSGPMPGNPTQPPSGDMEKYWSLLQDLSAKVDKVLEALSANYTGKQAPDVETDETHSGEAKTFK